MRVILAQEEVMVPVHLQAGDVMFHVPFENAQIAEAFVGYLLQCTEGEFHDYLANIYNFVRVTTDGLNS